MEEPKNPTEVGRMAIDRQLIAGTSPLGRIAAIVARAATGGAALPLFGKTEPAFRPPTMRTEKLRGPITCRASELVQQTVPGRANLRRARDGRLYTINAGTLRRLHAKPRGKAARRAEKEARRAAK